jgi:hypothetical protein
MASDYYPTDEDRKHAEWLLRGTGLTLEQMPKKFLNQVAQMNQADDYYVSRRAAFEVDWAIKHPKPPAVVVMSAGGRELLKKAIQVVEQAEEALNEVAAYEYVKIEGPEWLDQAWEGLHEVKVTLEKAVSK